MIWRPQVAGVVLLAVLAVLALVVVLTLVLVVVRVTRRPSPVQQTVDPDAPAPPR
jgi:hypothetical protein